jgi:uncharacterized protein (DUF2141 family)
MKLIQTICCAALTEGHGFSNNAIGNMGPPSFEQARFTLPAGGATVRVSLR